MIVAFSLRFFYTFVLKIPLRVSPINPSNKVSKETISRHFLAPVIKKDMLCGEPCRPAQNECVSNPPDIDLSKLK